MKRKSKGNSLGLIVIVVLVIALLSFNGLVGLFSPKSGNAQTTRDVAMSCTLDMYTQFHIHPHLEIVINGIQQKIPSEIGITNGCMHPLHTHDASGTIHVESPEKKDFTLADFFAVWNQPFSKNEILGYKADATHEIVVTVDGRQNSEFENLILQDLQQIKIEYKQK